MKLSNLRKEKSEEKIFLIADVINCTKENEPDQTVWVSIPNQYGEYLSDNRYDGFLVALLYPAMVYGEDIEVDGIVSKRLLRNINKFVQDILLAYDSKLHKINISAKETTNEILSTAKHIGTGFSGGVDSFSTIYDNFVLENDPEYKIDSLVCLNVGSHGTFGDEKTKKLFQNRYNFLKRYADIVDLPYIPVDSNIHYFCKEHYYTCILTLVAGILCMQNAFVRYYVASSTGDYKQWTKTIISQKGINIDEFSEPYLLPLLSTETTEFISDGIQYTRCQKTIRISSYPLTKHFLDVCMNEPQKKNCGVCKKCARVGLTLSVVDKLDEYKDVFNVESFRKNGRWLMSRAIITYKTDFFMGEIVDFAREHGKKYPNRFLFFPICVVVFAFGYLKRRGVKEFHNAVRRLLIKIRQER